MATYKPQRRTEDGTEDVKFPISVIEGLEFTTEDNGKVLTIEEGSPAWQTPSKAISYLSTSLNKNNTLSELVAFLRENGITPNDRCLLHCTGTDGGILFSDVVVKIGNAFAGDTLITVNEWFEPANPISYYATLSTSTTIGGVIAARDDLLETTEKTIVGAINELNGKTVDKVVHFEQFSSNKHIYAVDTDGISHGSTSYFTTKDNIDHEFTSSSIVPIAAGDNVTFEIDEENQTVKINATGGSGDSSFDMPIIRFSALRSYDGTMFLTSTNYFYFVVSIIGGGALQEGDQLELCVMRSCKRSASETAAGQKRHRLRKLYRREITTSEVGKTSLSLTVDGNSVDQLFKNDSYGGGKGCWSNIYLRIRRPIYNDTGEEYNAKFSNIIKLEKSFNPQTMRFSLK